MSDDQPSTPTDPYATSWPYPQDQAIQPYAQPSPSQAPYGPATGSSGGAFPHPTVVAPRMSPAHIVIAWVFAVLTIGYFLPWAISATRQKSNTLAIGLLNFLVGWTLIGWIAALVMSVMNEPTRVTNVAYTVAPMMHVGPQAAPPGWYPDQFGVRRYWDGQRWTDHTAP